MSTTHEAKSRGIRFQITKENYQRAVTANSQACVVADAIKEQYPEFSNVKVNVATIRVTDKERGEQYIFLTPPSVGETILAFDQGWPEESFPKQLRIRQAVKVIPIIRSASNLKIKSEKSAARLAELEAKEQSGETLTRDEKRALTLVRNRKEPPSRPTTYGPQKAEVIGNDVVVQGRPPHKHPRLDANLLDGRTRHFGAKTAQPSEVFKRAVKDAVKADRAKRRRQSVRK